MNPLAAKQRSQDNECANRWIRIAVVTFSLFVIGVQNLATHNDKQILRPNPASQVGIGYGWPASALAGSVDRQRYLKSTFPAQFWNSTTSLRPVPLGIAIDFMVSVVLCFSAYQAAKWVLTNFDLRLTLKTIFGLFTFIALVISVRIHSWQVLVNVDPNYPFLDMTDMALTYVENITWALVFIACLITPSMVGKAIKSLIQNASFSIHR